MNAMIYQTEYAFLTKRLDIVDRTLAWLEGKGRRFTRTARDLGQEQADLAGCCRSKTSPPMTNSTEGRGLGPYFARLSRRAGLAFWCQNGDRAYRSIA